jgi:hypothetical protein
MATDQDHESKALTALRRAVAKALDRKRRLGQYAVVWRDGRPVRLEPEDLVSSGVHGLDASAPASSVREPGPHADGRDDNGQ